jgi:cobalt-zinc-cadmium efflux system membrane fusion protein
MRGKFIHVVLSLLIFSALSLAFVGLVGRPGSGARAATAAGETDECGEQGCQDECQTAEPQTDDGHDHHESDGPPDIDELAAKKCEHDVLIIDCDECRYEAGVAKIDPALAQALLEYQPVRSAAGAARQLRLTGQIQLDLTRVVEIASAGSGRVETIHKILGDTVKASDVLAVVQSSDLGQAQAGLLEALAKLDLARQTFEREKDLHEQQISSQADFLAARNELAAAEAAAIAARKRLNLFGLDDGQIEAFVKAGSDSVFGRLVLTAPMDGTVIEQQIVRGQLVNPTDTVCRIADLSRVWIWCDLYESDLAALHERIASEESLEAKLNVRAFPGTVFKATVEMIGSQVDPDTRTLKVRLAADNPGQKLKPGMFIEASVDLVDSGTVLRIPETAALCDEGQYFAFVRLDDELWVRRDITIGRTEDGEVEVLDGLDEGDVVATKGAFMFKSEVLKEKMGAGCAH